MDTRYKLKTAATLYPASLADLKRNLHIPVTDVETDRDQLLQDLVYEAIIKSQKSTGRQYCPATYILYLDAYPDDDELEITLGPVASITSVKYYEAGAVALTTVSSSKYQLDNSELTARLRFFESFTPDPDRMNPVEIEFINGWVAETGVPLDLKQAIILRATEAYLNPENQAASKWLTAAESKERNYKVTRY
jgi:uncharacterized phiE125 gp8 family phage protein